MSNEFPAQRASNAENVSIWWRLHDVFDNKTNGAYFECSFSYRGNSYITRKISFRYQLFFHTCILYGHWFDLLYLCIPFAAKLRLTTKPSVNLIHPFDPNCLIIHCCPIILSNLTRWGRVTNICVGEQTIIGSDNGLSPGRCQAITRTNAWILSIEPWGTNFSEILIEIHTFSFQKMHLKMSSVKWRPSCLGLISICASPRKQTDT